MTDAAVSDAPPDQAAASAAAPGFLGAASQESPAQAAPPPRQGAANFLDPSYSENGKFREGWAKALEDAGFPRLAKKGMLATDEKTFLKSIDDTLQFVGKKAGHLPPGEGSTPEEIAEYRKQIGAPLDPKEYGFKPEKLPPGMEWDEATGAQFEALMHKHHVPAPFAKEAAGFYAEVMEKTAQQAREAGDARIAQYAQASEARFRQEWGFEFDTRRIANQDFAKAMGFDTENDPLTKEAFSRPEFVDLIDRVRRESKGVLPGANSESANSMSAEQQLQDYMEKHPAWERNSAEHSRVLELTKLVTIQRERRK